MIGKIHRTAKNSGFGSNRGGRIYNSYTAMHITSHDFIKDSSEFSNASKYLRTVNWRLHRLKREKNRLSISFQIDDFLFDIYISLQNIFTLNKLSYKITRLRGDKPLISAQFTIFLEGMPPKADSCEIKLGTLSNFFNRLSKIPASDLSFLSKSLIDELIDNYETALYREFNLINSALLSFIEKYENLSFKMISVDNHSHNWLKVENINIFE